MLTFYGTHLELTVDQILARQDGPRLCAAHDPNGTAWLIHRVRDTATQRAWICAPLSP
jgi:hypothetical protein